MWRTAVGLSPAVANPANLPGRSAGPPAGVADDLELSSLENGGTPIARSLLMVFGRENPSIKMDDDWGYPYFFPKPPNIFVSGMMVKKKL